GWQWSATPTGNALAFNYKFFDVNATNISIETNKNDAPFTVTISGKAGLHIDGISGSVGYEGFEFTPTEIVNKGKFTSGSFTLLDIFSLTLGEFTFETAEGEETFSRTF